MSLDIYYLYYIHISNIFFFVYFLCFTIDRTEIDLLKVLSNQLNKIYITNHEHQLLGGLNSKIWSIYKEVRNLVFQS